MPEGPSLRKFHHLVSPFVGQQVVKTGGSSKKLCPAVLQSLWLLDAQVRLVLHFGGGGFLAFYSCQMSWSPPPELSPTCDILSEAFHRGQALEALGRAQPVCYTLMDQRFFSGLGNIIKNEALYRAGIHPLTPGALLTPSQLEALVDHVVQFSAEWLKDKFQGTRRHTQIYRKEQCPAGHQVLKEALGPPAGLQRLTWWCPQCQPPLPPEEPQ
ncbi:PREDICTED: endonuclease 8-like 2 isoform X2 [Dipodomys ordii]|uniref:Endonuclease 8-like 2 n=1 Tax=Dipodomys ordii TaxID=10020 RepID=A0A1S3FTI5_DIPOR|nr:PREDICTED: endonuclease 8-like 2 isoform X2 [Dipodomys ordii]